MLRITQPAATTAGTAEHPVATAGRLWVRYALVVVIAWIGALKFSTYEATAIQPLVSLPLAAGNAYRSRMPPTAGIRGQRCDLRR